MSKLLNLGVLIFLLISCNSKDSKRELAEHKVFQKKDFYELGTVRIIKPYSPNSLLHHFIHPPTPSTYFNFHKIRTRRLI